MAYLPLNPMPQTAVLYAPHILGKILERKNISQTKDNKQSHLLLNTSQVPLHLVKDIGFIEAAVMPRYILFKTPQIAHPSQMLPVKKSNSKNGKEIISIKPHSTDTSVHEKIPLKNIKQNCFNRLISSYPILNVNIIFVTSLQDNR